MAGPMPRGGDLTAWLAGASEALRQSPDCIPPELGVVKPGRGFMSEQWVAEIRLDTENVVAGYYKTKTSAGRALRRLVALRAASNVVADRRLAFERLWRVLAWEGWARLGIVETPADAPAGGVGGAEAMEAEEAAAPDEAMEEAAPAEAAPPARFVPPPRTITAESLLHDPHADGGLDLVMLAPFPVALSADWEAVDAAAADPRLKDDPTLRPFFQEAKTLFLRLTWDDVCACLRSPPARATKRRLAFMLAQPKPITAEEVLDHKLAEAEERVEGTSTGISRENIERYLDEVVGTVPDAGEDGADDADAEVVRLKRRQVREMDTAGFATRMIGNPIFAEVLAAAKVTKPLQGFLEPGFLEAHRAELDAKLLLVGALAQASHRAQTTPGSAQDTALYDQVRTLLCELLNVDAAASYVTNVHPLTPGELEQYMNAARLDDGAFTGTNRGRTQPHTERFMEHAGVVFQSEARRISLARPDMLINVPDAARPNTTVAQLGMEVDDNMHKPITKQVYDIARDAIILATENELFLPVRFNPHAFNLSDGSGDRGVTLASCRLRLLLFVEEMVKAMLANSPAARAAVQSYGPLIEPHLFYDAATVEGGFMLHKHIGLNLGEMWGLADKLAAMKFAAIETNCGWNPNPLENADSVAAYENGAVAAKQGNLNPTMRMCRAVETFRSLRDASVAAARDVEKAEEAETEAGGGEGMVE